MCMFEIRCRLAVPHLEFEGSLASSRWAPSQTTHLRKSMSYRKASAPSATGTVRKGLAVVTAALLLTACGTNDSPGTNPDGGEIGRASCRERVGIAGRRECLVDKQQTP